LIQTNVLELVLDKEDSLEDPSSTAIPFAQTAQAVRGNGRRHEEKTQGITDRE
jgi:hypothetical protein